MALPPLSACAGTVVRWRPSLVSQVPDSTVVRIAEVPGQPPILGRALDWDRGRPKLVTSRGDTIRAPDSAVLEVRLPEKRNHHVAGALLGWAVGIGVSYAFCPPPKKYCGEEDPTPLLGIGLGALIGWLIKTDQWVPVRRDTI